MKRLKSALATVLMVSAGAAAIGLGVTMAVAAMVIGLVVAAATWLVAGATPHQPIAGAEIAETAA